jgi:hypothetical protein
VRRYPHLDLMSAVTQQYIVREFSSLLGDLQRAPGQRLAAVHDQRREIERSPLSMLPPLARNAIRWRPTACSSSGQQARDDQKQ